MGKWSPKLFQSLQPYLDVVRELRWNWHGKWLCQDVPRCLSLRLYIQNWTGRGTIAPVHVPWSSGIPVWPKPQEQVWSKGTRLFSNRRALLQREICRWFHLVLLLTPEDKSIASMRDRSRQGQLRSEELERKFANVPRGVLLAVEALLTSNGSNGRSAIIDYSRSWLRKASTRRKRSVTPRRPKTEGYCKKRWKMMEGILKNRNKIWTDFTSRMQPRRSRSNWFHTCSLSAQANRSYCMTFRARIDQSLRVRDLQCSFHSGSKVGMPKKCPRNAQEMPRMSLCSKSECFGMGCESKDDKKPAMKASPAPVASTTPKWGDAKRMESDPTWWCHVCGDVGKWNQDRLRMIEYTF